jgi:hypothetical protein
LNEYPVIPPMSSAGSAAVPRLLKGGTPCAVVSKTTMSGSGTVSPVTSTFVASSASITPLSFSRAQVSTCTIALFVLPAIFISMDTASIPHDSAGAGGVGTGVTQRWLALVPVTR